MIPLFEHQEKIIKENKLWAGLFTGTGSMKTRTSLELAEGRILIICEKQGRDDRTFESNAVKFNIKKDFKVISKEDFRRDWESLPQYDTVIIDEAHNFFGVSPDTRQEDYIQIPKTSQLFDGLKNYLRNKRPKRFYMLTATPAVKPMHVYALAVLFGKEWNYFDFREKYYFQKKVAAHKFVWIAKNNDLLKDRLAEIVNKFGYTGGLSDFMDVPEQTYLTKYFKLTDEQKNSIKELRRSNADPMAVRSYIRTIENGVLYGNEIVKVSEKRDKLVGSKKTFSSEKIDYIIERASEFKKMLIFASYTAQVEAIAEALKKEGYDYVKAITGQTDRSEVFKMADRSDKSILVVQSSISAGYELPSFPVVIYASYSNRVLHKIQGDGRVLRGNALKKNLYLSLVVKGGLDEQCYNTVSSGVDFNEKIMTN